MQVVKIAHISDLHFDEQKKNGRTWQFLANYLKSDVQPDLLLVTGDIVDTPNEALYAEAKEAIQALCRAIRPARPVQYFVCPGNHDRHYLGNVPPEKTPGFIARWFGYRKSALENVVRAVRHPDADAFDRVFQNLIPQLNPGYENRFNITLGSDGNRWNLRLLGIDSSIDADAFARGYVDLSEINKLKDAMSDADDIDLAILLVHHHVFPVRALEEAQRASTGDLTKLTSLVNAGTLVEALAAAHVDIALHGHEHAANWGRYATFEHGGGETNVIGAGSATGTVTSHPCEQSRASFNVIELRQDRTVGVVVYGSDGARWNPGPPFEIYDSEALRRARFLRRGGDAIRRQPESDVVRYLECSRERDWFIRETRTNVYFGDKPHLVLGTTNTTGTPTDLSVKLIETGWQPRDASFEGTSHENVYNYDCPIPAEIAAQTQTLQFSFRWLGGALVTQEELNAIDEAKRGPHRRDGFEYGAIRVDGYFRELRLVVRLPPEYAPIGEGDDNNAVRAFFEGPRGAPVPDAAAQADVIDRLRIVGRGLYTLVIPYPRRDALYGIKWRPPPAPAITTAGAQFVAAAKAQGDRLARTFHEGLSETPLFGRCTIGLYIPNHASRSLVRAGAYPLDGSATEAISFAHEDNLVIPAWRGSPGVAYRPDYIQGGFPDIGCRPDERALLTLPVRCSMSWTNDPPWGVIRIGVREIADDIQAFLHQTNAAALKERLLWPMVSMLAVVNGGAASQEPRSC